MDHHGPVASPVAATIFDIADPGRADPGDLGQECVESVFQLSG